MGLAKQYDRAGGNYAPGATIVWDKSTIKAGECDQYDDECNKGDKDPVVPPPTDLMDLAQCLKEA